MNTSNAIAIVEQKYGSIEELGYLILEEKRDALDESLSLPVRAEAVGLPVTVFARVLASPAFRSMLRADLVNTRFGFTEEEKHITHMVGVAQGEERRVMNSKGDIGYVDQAPGDVINAGKYLNEMRGTPIEEKTSTGRSIIVNFHMASGGDDVPRTIDVTPNVYQPSRAGELPPAAVLSRTGTPALDAKPTQPRVDVEFGTLYGEGAKEKEADLDLAALPPAREDLNDGRPKTLWPGNPTRRKLAVRLAVQRTRPAYDDD